MNSMNIDEKINFLFNEIKLLKQNNASSFDQKINIMNNKIDNIYDTLNKKEDDIKNLINEKDSIIKDLKEKLLKQENEIQKKKSKIQEIKNIINELVLFKENITSKIDQIKNIDNAQMTYSYEQMVFQSEEFNSLSIDEFKKKFSFNPNLSYLKEIHDGMIEGGHFTFRELDPRGNKFESWSNNQKRGNYFYDPPIGWIGIGLNVLFKFDNGNNTWIGNNNSKGEWAVAYHGVGCGQSSENVQRIIRYIFNSGFRPGVRQIYENFEDLNHKGKKVGRGVVFSPLIKEAEDYSGVSILNGIKYKTVIMVRIKPSAIRSCNFNNLTFWIVNGTCDEVRPYRILFKKC